MTADTTPTATDLRLQEATRLVTRMAEDHAVSWSHVSRSTSLSTHKLRAYHRGVGAPQIADVDVLRTLLARLDELAAAGIADPSAWPFDAVVPGYTLTPQMLEDEGANVLDLARAADRPAHLDVVRAGWRTDFWSDYECVPASDGGPSIQLKDVVARAAHQALVEVTR